MKRAAAVLLLVLLGGCGDKDAADTASQEKAVASSSAKAKNGSLASAGLGGVTPNADRIATLGLLNKRNNLTQDVILKVGESRRAGNVIIKLESCERTAPWEAVKDEGAFVQVLVEERPAPKRNPEWREVFSGWLFKNSPALNVVEHPIYDVWVKNCAMNFPGDEAKPAAAASAQSAAKASVSDSGAASDE